MVIVRRLAAHVDHAVDRRASAEHLAARVDEASPVETRLGRGLHHPVRARVADAVQVSDRNADPVVRVAAPGFEQEHAGAGVFGQAVRQYAAGGAGAHDDVVVPAVEGLNARHALTPWFPMARGTTRLRPQCSRIDAAGSKTRPARAGAGRRGPARAGALQSCGCRAVRSTSHWIRIGDDRFDGRQRRPAGGFRPFECRMRSGTGVTCHGEIEQR